MILGLISFAIFIISEAYEFDKYDEWYVQQQYDECYCVSLAGTIYPTLSTFFKES